MNACFIDVAHDGVFLASNVHSNKYLFHVSLSKGCVIVKRLIRNVPDVFSRPSRDR